MSRYLSGLALTLDGQAIPPSELTLLNRTPGETGVPIDVAGLGPERGFYVRRGQTAEVRLGRAVTAGPHRVELRLELAGVRERTMDETVAFA